MQVFPSPQGQVRKGLKSMMLMSSVSQEGNRLGGNSTAVFNAP